MQPHCHSEVAVVAGQPAMNYDVNIAPTWRGFLSNIFFREQRNLFTFNPHFIGQKSILKGPVTGYFEPEDSGDCGSFLSKNFPL